MPMLTTLRMRLPVWPVQAPPRTRSEKSAMRSSTACTCGHDVLAVDHDRRAARRAQRHVQHGALLGDVDLLAPEHRVDAPAQVALVGELQEQLQRLVGDAVLRVVEVEPGALDGEALAAAGIVGEELAQVRVPKLLVVRRERLPGGPLRERAARPRSSLLSSRSAQRAPTSWSLFAAMQASSSFQDFTKASAPSF